MKKMEKEYVELKKKEQEEMVELRVSSQNEINNKQFWLITFFVFLAITQ